MPNYLYRCPACQGEMELFRKIDNRHDTLECARCGDLMELKIQAPALKDYPGSHRDEYTKTGPRK